MSNPDHLARREIPSAVRPAGLVAAVMLAATTGLADYFVITADFESVGLFLGGWVAMVLFGAWVICSWPIYSWWAVAIPPGVAVILVALTVFSEGSEVSSFQPVESAWAANLLLDLFYQEFAVAFAIGVGRAWAGRPR